MNQQLADEIKSTMESVTILNKSNKGTKRSVEQFEKSTDLLGIVDKDVKQLKPELQKFMRETKKKIEEDSVRLATLEEKMETVIRFLESYPLWVHETKHMPLAEAVAQLHPLIGICEEFDKRLDSFKTFATKVRELENRVNFLQHWSPTFGEVAENSSGDSHFVLGSMSPFVLK